MATTKICNRCGAAVAQSLDPAPRLVVVPASSPSTTAVAADMDCQIGLVTGEDADQQPIDYCGPCLLSVVMARVMPSADLAQARSAVDTIAAHREAVAVIVEPAARPPVARVVG